MIERKPTRLAEALWAVSKGVRFEVHDPEGNFEKARKHLEKGSILLYTNHFHTLDTTAIAHVIDQQLLLTSSQPSISPFDHITAIAARRHLDPERSKSAKIKSNVIERLQGLKGFHVIKVVQSYDMDSYEGSQGFNMQALRQARSLLRTPGQVVAIAPEGTRSKEGGLLKAEEGIETLFRLGGENTLALPVALHPYHIRPPFTKTFVEVGAPFSYQELTSEQAQRSSLDLSDLMMIRLAQLLPERNRGAYRELAAQLR